MSKVYDYEIKYLNVTINYYKNDIKIQTILYLAHILIRG